MPKGSQLAPEEAIPFAIGEYIVAFQMSAQYLRNQDVAKLICEFLGVDLADRRWVEPDFLTDVTDLVDLSEIGGAMLSSIKSCHLQTLISQKP